jgi:hypothetical protein
MDNRLYFIPILLRAIEAGTCPAALVRAFEEIRELGRREDFVEGYGQFRCFMAEVRLCADQEDERAAFLSSLAVALAVGALDEDEAAKDAAFQMMSSRPDWLSRRDAFLRELSLPDDLATCMEMVLCRGGDELLRIPAQSVHAAHEIRGISPDMYSLTLTTGWRVWESTLTEDDIEWARAFPRHPFQMAADTDKVKRVPSRTWRILDETIELRLFPGIETGVLEVLIRA